MFIVKVSNLNPTETPRLVRQNAAFSDQHKRNKLAKGIWGCNRQFLLDASGKEGSKKILYRFNIVQVSMLDP